MADFNGEEASTGSVEEATIDVLGEEPGASGVVDTAPPIVVLNPADGTPISRNRQIQATVTDVFLKRVRITAQYRNGMWEVVYGRGRDSEDRFSQAFIALSTRATIANGFNFFIKRSGGWPSTPMIHVEAYDTSSNEA